MDITRRAFVSLSAAALLGNKVGLAAPANNRGSFDVVILGATAAGVIAALAAVREGAAVCIIEQTMHVGGVLAAGLSVADTNRPQDVGGLTQQFLNDIGTYYGKAKPLYSWEPHVAESIFNRYLNSPKITVVLGCTLNSVSFRDGRIELIALSDGSYVQGSQWIDATYEGDLMAKSGVSWTVGRESVSKYQESLAGYRVTNIIPINPYGKNGQLVPQIHTFASRAETNGRGPITGQGDSKISAYNYRACLSTAANRIPFPQPPVYNPDDWITLTRVISQYGLTTHAGLMSGQSAGIAAKYCMENSSTLSCDAPGLGGWLYPVENWTARLVNIQQHRNFGQGFLYFLANDPSVPASVRADFQKYGLPPDEFQDNGNWPYQPYIREGRRMIGQYVMTQADVSVNSTYPDSVGIGQWTIDSHNCDFNAYQNGGSTVIAFDGGLSVNPDPIPRYQMPFRSILPVEISNLAVPICVSSSHVGFSAIRVEPSYMILGEAAGTAAGLGMKKGIDLSKVPIATLQARLVQFGGIIS